jgi:threonine/homoserine/homoserine lactone efflux protein
MVPVSRLLPFAAVVALVIAVPGPSVLFTISRALSVGRRCALLTVLGNSAGVYLQVTAVAFGVGTLVERSILVFTLIKWAGGAYLVYLGVQAVRHRRSLTAALAARAAPVPPWRAVVDGAVVGATNPKTIVFFVVALPQFASPASGHVPLQMLLLGTLFPVIALVLDSAWAFAAGTARAWFARSPRRLALIGGTGGLVMIGLGATLAVSGRGD